MALQDVFYIVGIIFLSLYSLMLIGFIIAAFYVKKKITNVSQNIKLRFTRAKESVTQPKEIARHVGEALASALLMRLMKR